jgi:hypothetical protein
MGSLKAPPLSPDVRVVVHVGTGADSDVDAVAAAALKLLWPSALLRISAANPAAAEDCAADTSTVSHADAAVSAMPASNNGAPDCSPSSLEVGESKAASDVACNGSSRKGSSSGAGLLLLLPLPPLALLLLPLVVLLASELGTQCSQSEPTILSSSDWGLLVSTRNENASTVAGTTDESSEEENSSSLASIMIPAAIVAGPVPSAATTCLTPGPSGPSGLSAALAKRNSGLSFRQASATLLWR